MKILLVYFSSSGNTKYIADLIQVGFKLANRESELIKLKDFNNSDKRLKHLDLFGIGGPIYAMSYPPNIMDWLHSLPMSKNKKKFFIFNTNAGLPGNAIQNAKEILEAKNYECIGMLEQVSPTRDSVIDSKYFKYVKWKKRDVLKSIVFGYKLAKSVKEKKKFFIDWSNDHIFGNIFRNFFGTFEKLFYRFFPKFIGFDTSKCRKCKLCEEKCPTKAIRFDDKPIISSYVCIACFNCMRVCPTNAISFKLFSNAEYFKGPHEVTGYIKPEKLLRKYSLKKEK